MTSSSRATSFLYWANRHWLALLNTFFGIYIIGAMLPPLLYWLKLERLAGWVYNAYQFFCHQLAFRSFFAGGEQYAYPREVAGTSLIPFEQYAAKTQAFDGIPLYTLSNALLHEARHFHGSAEMGYKFALCERDIGIWLTIFLFGLGFSLLRNRISIPILPITLFVLLGALPIAYDGGSQMIGLISETIAELIPVRESTPFWRTLTGANFGFFVGWLIFPRLQAEFSK